MNYSRIDTVRSHYEEWWEGKNKSPLCYLIYPKQQVDFSPVAKEWMAPIITKKWSMWQQEFVFGQGLELTWKTGDWRYVDEAIDFLSFFAEVTGHTADGYPFLLPGLGPGVGAAFISDFTQFHESTIWFQLKQPMSLEQIAQIDQPKTSYFEVAKKGVRRLVERLHDHFIIAIPDIGGALDVLASLHGTNELLMETLTSPEVLRDIVPKIDSMLHDFRETFSSIISPNNNRCYCECMRILSAKPTHIGMCDFSAMISPDAFDMLVRPSLEWEAKKYDGRIVYHMDGPGQMPHLPSLLSIEGIHAIQWVPGAGNPGTMDEKWYPLYKQIIDSGKKICLGGAGKNPEAIRRLFSQFPKETFFMPFTAKDKDDEESILRIVS